MTAPTDPLAQRQLIIAERLTRLESSLAQWETLGQDLSQRISNAQHNLDRVSRATLLGLLFIPALGLGLILLMWVVIAQGRYSADKRTAENQLKAAQQTILLLRADISRTRNALALASNAAFESAALEAMMGPMTDIAVQPALSVTPGPSDALTVVLVIVLISILLFIGLMVLGVIVLTIPALTSH